jgi:serine/threonine protein kinase/tetratricopeptide (TPR) repeat protein
LNAATSACGAAAGGPEFRANGRRRAQNAGAVIAIHVGDVLSLPELARTQSLDSDEFRVAEVIPGGMGVCLRVRQRPPAPDYALKVLHGDQAADEVTWERFLIELRVWLTLSACDGIVEAFCVFRYRETPVVASRWMEGGNLRTLMEKRDPEVFYRTMGRLVGALDWAYSKHRIIHRDLKPENILLDERGHAAVSDWGIARPLREPEPTPHPSRASPSGARGGTAQTLILGTVAYASPEQLLGGTPLDLRSDIYSLGCIMYEWDAGRPPYTGSWDEIREKKIRDGAPRISGLFRRTKFGADQIIARCLERERGHRFEDYESLASELSKAAFRKNVPFVPFVPRLRYQAVPIGAEVLRERVKRGDVVTMKGLDGRRSPVDISSMKPRLEEAARFAARGDWKKAGEIYASFFMPSLVKDLPDDPLQQAITLGHAACLLNEGKAAKARTALECLRNAAAKPVAWFAGLSRASLLLGDTASAERMARDGLSRFPKEAAILESVMAVQVALGRNEYALASVGALRATSRDARTLGEAGAFLLKTARGIPESRRPEALTWIREAVGCLRDAKKLDPGDTWVRYGLAQALFELGRFGEVLRELAGTSRGPYGDLSRAVAELEATCLRRTGAWAACLALTDARLKTWPESVPLRRARAEAIAEGLVFEAKGDVAADTMAASRDFFVTAVANALEREPSDFAYLARLREHLGEPVRAIELLREARRLYPASWELALVISRALERQGEFEEALAVTKEAVASAPFRTQTWRALAAAEGTFGRRAEQAAASKKAEALGLEQESLKTI